MKSNSKLPICRIMSMILLATTVILTGCQSGKSYPGYRLIEKRFVPEVNAECIYLEHTGSGARVFKIAADDPNKTFSIGFMTVPESDAGTPHIMEHSVLNGSKNFPVKSPFDILLKGSLNTFLNAMTSADWTVYPVASMNDKDYFNLMHVYLDAVFNPRIYDDPRIFMQEGWHYELTEKDAPLTIKGVVYNEMKGAFSGPTTELMYQIQKNLFPENGYTFSSGGHPEAIPELSYGEFLDFHRKYYHPSNSYIFLYGDADLAEELSFIDREYLSKYESSDFRAEFPLNPPFSSMKEAESVYSVLEGAETGDQTYLTMSFVIGRNTDPGLIMSLNVLADVLVNQETAPVRKALQEAGIGKDVNAFARDIQQNVFTIMVRNANPEDKEPFRSLVMEVIEKAAAEGLDKEAIEGTLNRMEFRLREGDNAQKGLIYNMQSLSRWMFAGDPFMGLEYEKPLANSKKALEEPVLEEIIRSQMLNNPYGLLLVHRPQPGLELERMKKLEEELAEYKSGLSDEELDELVITTRELMEYQQQEDSPEALATIPMLKLEDIGKEAAWYGVEEKEEAGVPVLFHPEFTNRVVYMNMLYDLRVLPQEMIPYASLLSELLGKLGTENYSFGEIDKALKIHTGGFRTSLVTYLEEHSDEAMLPKFSVSVKSTYDKVGKALELTAEILAQSLYDDQERIDELLNRHQANLELMVNQNGMMVARNRMASYLSNRGMFDELTSGAEYYWFITRTAREFRKDPQALLEKLSEAASLLFNKENMIAAVTCQEDDYGVFSSEMGTFAEAFPPAETTLQEWKLQPVPKNEAFLTASKVQYVVKGYDFKKLGYQWSGKMNVLDQVLSTDWLQTRIRVMGGAYGGFSWMDKSGMLLFMSYRDPNLKETLDNYDATPEYLKNFEADETGITRYIIGTIAGLDSPLTPSQKGNIALRYYFEKTPAGQLQKEREEVLSTSVEDLRNMAGMISDILGKDVYCVYGNDTRIKENKHLFRDLLVLQR